jgi:ribosomal RNA methyltransferase Nop2
VKLVDTGIEIAEEGLTNYKGKKFHADMKKCVRTYPHLQNMDGFFVAKFKKIDNTIPEAASQPHSGTKRPKIKKIKDFTN